MFWLSPTFFCRCVLANRAHCSICYPYLRQQVNGQNVVGIKDKEIAKIIDEADQIVTVTVIPNFLFKHMTAK